MKLIVDHSPLLSNVSCCVPSAVFLCPEKNYYYPLWLPSIKASRAVSESLLALVFSIEQWAIRKPCHFRTNNSICLLAEFLILLCSAVVGVTITQRTYTFNCRETGARVKIAP